MKNFILILIALLTLSCGQGNNTSADKETTSPLICLQKGNQIKKSPQHTRGANAKPGLYVENGVLTRKGKPYRAIGANYFDLFFRRLLDSKDTSYREGLIKLSEAKIPFVRFNCNGYWPTEWKLYMTDKKEFFNQLDDVVKTAEKYNVGLIPSLFFHNPTVIDLVGEHIDQFGNTNSKSIKLIREFTTDVVTRYKDSPAIWGWEFGNEGSLGVDLPNASEQRPPVWTVLGTASNRTERDEITSGHLLTAYKEFAKTVRKYDKDRIIISGNCEPRFCAWHNTKERSWKEDSPQQFGEIFLRDNPDPMDTLTVRLYPGKIDKYPSGAKNVDDLTRIMMNWSVKAKKPLFIGEFGAQNSLGKKKMRKVYEEIIAAIEKNNVPLSAFWVYDLPGQDEEWNITFANDRAYMIQMVIEANERIGNP